MLKRLFRKSPEETPEYERRHLMLAVSVLLHEARRADYAQENAETAAAQHALVELFGLEPAQAAALLEQGREKAEQLSSYYAPLATIKRDWGVAERVRLLEHLWRVSLADSRLDYYEDHYVRKIAHLLHVPHTDNMLARNRARDALAAV